MQLPIDVGQGCSGFWQSAFIRENILSLGHAAWQGHLDQGQGLVVCDVEVFEAASVDWSRDVVRYKARYIPAATVPEYLKAQGLQVGHINRLMDKVQTYQPQGELLVAIAGEGLLEVSWLHNLAISPPDCYQQVCNRWDEFALKSSAGEEV